MANHPNLLAFEVLVQPDVAHEDLDATYHFITAKDLSQLRHILSKRRHWCVLAVHHVSDEDGFLLTDVIWNMATDKAAYSDEIATDSFARQS